MGSHLVPSQDELSSQTSFYSGLTLPPTLMMEDSSDLLSINKSSQHHPQSGHLHRDLHFLGSS